MTAETEAAANGRTLVFLTAPLRGALKSFNTADTEDFHNVKGPLPTAGCKTSTELDSNINAQSVQHQGIFFFIAVFGAITL